MLPLRTELERNVGSDRLSVPFYAHVECHQILDRGPNFEIPVRASYLGMQKTLSVEIAGFRLMTEHLNAVPALVERLIEGIVRRGRLPHYVFIARDAGIVYPVYTIGDEVIVPTPNGPLFQHVELAKVRSRLTDYLHDIKVLGANGRTDKFHVRGVDRHTLQLVRPRFYLKKRVPDEDDFWAPVFRSKDGERIYAYAASERRETTIVGGREVFALQALVAEALQQDNRLHNTHDLRPDRLFPATWKRLAANLTADGELNVGGVTLPLYQTDNLTLALEPRPDEERFSLFLGKNAGDVQQRAEQDFARRGIGVYE